MVHSLLVDNGMADYYRFEKTPGISQKKETNTNYDYLNNPEITAKLLTFDEGGISKVTLSIPQIHCSSCLWLLEHLSMLDSAIIKSSVDFIRKKASITFKNHAFSLSDLVSLLNKIGYEPLIQYDQLDRKIAKPSFDKKLVYKLGLAGFSFGNIMLLSFPEYLGFNKASYLFHIGYINIILTLPVLLYSGIDYIKSAIRGLQMRDFNIDLPIALGMIALFGRSIFEILSFSGEGYLDSFSGFVFFLLIGRWFQGFTYQALDFDRNYKSYFPISANVLQGDKWISKSLDHLLPGDILRIRNEELIPVDGILHKGNARIDYSFVTGESNLISKIATEKVYAGGRHKGQSIEVLVTHKVDQSYLTQLWNEDTFQQENTSNSSKLIAGISQYFTTIVILLAFGTMLYWLTLDIAMSFNTFTAVLIVACPCALALAMPFTYGNVLRLLATNGVYFKNIQTIEQIQDIDYVIFDKTGTITDSNSLDAIYHGKPLTIAQSILIKSACRQSSHPLSRAIVATLQEMPCVDIEKYKDDIGLGLTAQCGENHIKVGSSKYIFDSKENQRAQGVFIEIDGVYIGNFQFRQAFRENVAFTLATLNQRYKVGILSGDTDHERDRIASFLPDGAGMYFNQSPKEKLYKIKELQDQGYKVMMIGDGLNDSGALKQANVGLVISDETNNFSPSCDGIIDASSFSQLNNYLKYLTKTRYIIYGAFGLAFFYNAIGMSFAISGQLSPVIAAILMPLSSISVVLYGVFGSWLLFQCLKQE